jgi:DNA-binding MarR family transcriptional regulator
MRVATDTVPAAASIEAWELIRRVVLRVDQAIVTEVGDVGVPGQAFGVLHILLNAPKRRLPMTYLARQMGMTAGGFTKLADRLGRAGLIDRRGAEGDRRVVYATLTPEGVRIARKAERRYEAALRRHVLSAVSAQRLSSIASGLAPLDDAAPSVSPELGLAQQPRDPALPDRRRSAR